MDIGYLVFFEFKKTITKKNFEHSKLQFLGGLQNALSYAGVLGISLSLGETVYILCIRMIILLM